MKVLAANTPRTADWTKADGPGYMFYGHMVASC